MHSSCDCCMSHSASTCCDVLHISACLSYILYCLCQLYIVTVFIFSYTAIILYCNNKYCTVGAMLLNYNFPCQKSLVFTLGNQEPTSYMWRPLLTVAGSQNIVRLKINTFC